MSLVARDPLVAHLLRYTATTVGRDKVYRAIQYWSRFFAWYLHRKGYDVSTIAKFNTLKAHFGLVRKAMRIGKNVEHLKAASVASLHMNELQDSHTKHKGLFGIDDRYIFDALAVGRQLGYAGYLTLDIGVWANSLKLVNFRNGKKIADDAYRFWATGLMFSIVSGLYKIVLMNRRAKAANDNPEDKLDQTKAQKERADVNHQLVLDLLDITVPTWSLGFLPIDDGLVGIAGFLSSLMGIRQQWNKVK